jgi:mRNA interferase MazF
MGLSRRPARVAESKPLAVRRGEIWWIDLDPTRGSEIRKTRPCLVIGADGLNRVRSTVLVVPLSTGPSPRPPIIIATSSAGDASVAICDQLRAVDRSRFVRPGGRLSAADLRAVEAGLRAVLAFA